MKNLVIIMAFLLLAGCGAPDALKEEMAKGAKTTGRFVTISVDGVQCVVAGYDTNTHRPAAISCNWDRYNGIGGDS